MTYETWRALDDLRWDIRLLLIDTAGNPEALRDGLRGILDDNAATAKAQHELALTETQQ